jgi:hypothetical protein
MHDHSLQRWRHEHVFLGEKPRRHRRPLSHVTVEVHACPEHGPVPLAA